MMVQKAAARSARGVMALAIYVAVGTITGVTWAPFSSVPKLSKELYGMDDSKLSWQQNVTNICQLVLTPFAAWLLASSPRGLSISLRISAVLLAVQSGLWATLLLHTPDISEWWQPLALIGSAVGGGLAAFFQGASSQLSARFFDDDRSRARSTSIAYAGQYVGVCGAQLWFRAIETEEGFRMCLLICLGVSLALALVTLFFFPTPIVNSDAEQESEEIKGASGTSAKLISSVHTPLLSKNAASTPIRVPEKEGDLSFWDGVKLCRSRTVILLVIIAGITQGISFSWQATLPMTFYDLGQGKMGQQLGYTFTGDDGNILSFSALLAYTISSTVSGDICERLFRNQHQKYLLCTLFLSILSSCALWILIPSEVSPTIGPLTVWMKDKDVCYWSVFSAVTSVGLTTGLVVPPALELLAEASYPAPAGTTANAVMWFTELMCVPLTAVIPMVAPRMALPVTTLMVLASVTVCFIFNFGVTNTYNRRNARNHPVNTGIVSAQANTGYAVQVVT
eukprot:m.228018 g.228018  ORF g.228018 m.228018 type:complete len:509 (-) comp25963_c0_seq1:5655-7181(-)